MRGLASDLANVKVGLFWTALVPQYMPKDGGVLLPASMVVTMAGLAFVCLGCFALAARRLRSALDRPRVSRAVNGAVGGCWWRSPPSSRARLADRPALCWAHARRVQGGAHHRLFDRYRARNG
jgi:hypothetical protein